MTVPEKPEGREAECSCAMTEASMRRCSVHGEDEHRAASPLPGPAPALPAPCDIWHDNWAKVEAAAQRGVWWAIRDALAKEGLTLAPATLATARPGADAAPDRRNVSCDVADIAEGCRRAAADEHVDGFDWQAAYRRDLLAVSSRLDALNVEEAPAEVVDPRPCEGSFCTPRCAGCGL